MSSIPESSETAQKKRREKCLKTSRVKKKIDNTNRCRRVCIIAGCKAYSQKDHRCERHRKKEEKHHPIAENTATEKHAEQNSFDHYGEFLLH
jgi:hypothetical protein